MKKLLLFTLVSSVSFFAPGQTFTVDDTGNLGDANPGDGVCATSGSDCTLRAAIEESNASAGVNTIFFNIPNSDPNYTSGAREFWTITPTTDLPTISEATVLDATSQTGTGNINIVLDGSLTTSYCLNFSTGGSEVYGFYITDFSTGIRVSYNGAGITIGDVGKGNTIVNCTNGIGGIISSDHVIQGNYIGTDENGTIGIGNTSRGLNFGNNSPDLIIGGSNAGEGNVISGNGGSGIYMNVCGGSQIVGNYFGTDPTGLIAIPNAAGIYLGNSGGSQVIDNVISGNTGDGISINASSTCIIRGNYIGVGSDGITAISNDVGIHGFTVSSASNHIIGGVNAGEANIISNNINQGILFTNANHINNQIIGNTIFCNGDKGIDLNGAANSNKSAPFLGSAAAGSASGTGEDGDVIHLYRDNSGCKPTQGAEYLGSTTVASGVWTIIEPSILATDLLNATATDASGNTSEFIDMSSFITTWKTDNAGVSATNQIRIPTQGFGFNYDIYWEEVGNAINNGTEPLGQTGDYIVTFPSVGTYRVEISGDFPNIRFNNGGDKDKILTIEQWGDVVWNTMDGAFSGCSNLTIPASDAPDLSSVSSMYRMFYFATSINDEINHWDVSNITDMNTMFASATSFNKDLDNWDVGNVTTMNQMFLQATAFNGDVSTWDVSKVTTTLRMFYECFDFDQNLSAWDVGQVIATTGMFFNTSFNQDISNWNTCSLVYMEQMFKDVSDFNSDLNNWDVSNVINMQETFRGATSFNQNLDNWNVGALVNMSEMFSGATAFDGLVTNWDVSNVTNMVAVFNNATSFNQNLGGWDISNVTNMVFMLDNTALSVGNYDATLIGWEALPSLQSLVTFGANGLNYCTGAIAWQDLTDGHSWVISDAGIDCTPEIAVFIDIYNNISEIVNNQATDVFVGNGPLGLDYNQDIKIENIGGTVLNIASISVSGVDFSIIGAPLAVAPFSSEKFTVRLSGAVLGQYNANVTILSDDADESTFIFPIEGHILPPFDVVSQTPIPNEIGVNANSDVFIVFSDDIGNFSTQTFDDAFTVRSQLTGLVTGSLGNDDEELTFDPDVVFLAGDIITVTIGPNFESLSNIPLNKPISFEFRIATTNGPETPDFFDADSTNLISTSLEFPNDVFVVDLDSDGDMDIISAASDDNSVYWHENDGNQNFTDRLVNATNNYVIDVSAADMDNDGDMDILGASLFGNEISWFENDGSENFTKKVIDPASTAPQNVIPIDMDGDGDMDVLASDNSQVSWYENDGSQNYSQNIISGTILSPFGVYPGDIDGDGDMDLIASSRTQDKVFWFDNDGSQNFTEKTVGSSLNDARGAYLVDLDQDGNMDVLTSAFLDNEVVWFKNDGSQNFSENIIINTFKPGKILAADMDGDGDLDIIISQNSQKLEWYENSGGETFTINPISTTYRDYFGVDLADLDQDGNIDIVYCSGNDDAIGWARNTALPPTVQASLINFTSVNPIQFDINWTNGDGAERLVVVSENFLVNTFPNDVITYNASSILGSGDDLGSGDYVVYAGSGNSVTVTGLSQGNIYHVRIFEYNGLAGDENYLLSTAVDNPISLVHGMSVVSTNPSANSIDIPSTANITVTLDETVLGTTLNTSNIQVRGDQTGLISTAYGSAGSVITITPTTEFQPGEIIRITITNGVTSDTGSPLTPHYSFEFRVATQDGPATPDTFVDKTTNHLGITGSASGIYVADIDQDGNMDIISGLEDDGLSWFRNDGSQNFSQNIVDASSTYVIEIEAVDLDDDGDIDVLTSGLDGIIWFENDGSSNFTLRLIDSDTYGIIKITDLDGDGDLDFILGDEFSQEIRWYENDGNENFSPTTIDSPGNPIVAIWPVDMNGDGLMDVMYAIDFNVVFILYNDGLQNFTLDGFGTGWTDVPAARHANAADLDGDGDVDIVYTSDSGYETVWFRNEGGGNFTDIDISGPSDGNAIIEDLDGDGDMDILMGGTNIWYENDGSENFTDHPIPTTGDVFVADMDNDGDVDIVTSNGFLAWYENMVPGSNPPHMYWTENLGNATGDDEIHRTDLDGNDFEQFYSGFADEISGLVLDTANNRLYWTDAADAEIIYGEIGFDGLSSGPTKLLDYNPSSANSLVDLALDLANGHIYFTHGKAETGFANKIARVNIDGTNDVELINLGFEEPFGIDLDLVNGKIYYTTNLLGTGLDARLYRANLDGSNPEELFYSNTGFPYSYIRDVKIDPVNEIVYWSFGGEDVPGGEIYFNDLNEAAPFAAPSSFSFSGEPRGIDIDLYNNKLYWVCRGADDGITPPMIMRSDLDGANIENIFTVTMFPPGFPPGPPGSAFIALDLRGLIISCASPPSTSAGVDQTICEGEIVSLVAIIGGSATTIIWNTSGDGNFDNANSLTPQYTPGTNDITTGTVILTATTDDPDGAGNCTAISDDLMLTIEAIQISNAGVDQAICLTDVAVLTGNIGGSAIAANWTTNGDGSFDNSSSLTTNYTPGSFDISTGSSTLTLTTIATYCAIASDELIILINGPINVNDQSGTLKVAETIIIDVLNGASLNAGDVLTTMIISQPQKGTASINSDGNISYTAIEGNSGLDEFDFQINNQCNEISSATILITIENEAPIFNDSNVTATPGKKVTIDIVSMMTDLNGNIDLSSIKIIQQPLSGAPATLDANNNLIVDYVGIIFFGTDEVVIEVCDFDGACTESIIFIEIEALPIVAFNAVSPNGDGRHDFLEFQYIEAYPNNEVKIFNRWGDIIFTTSGYDNQNNIFIGDSNKGGNKKLPAATYYYTIVLTLPTGEVETINGFFELRR